MQLRAAVILVFTCFTACTNTSDEKSEETNAMFDKAKWKIKNEVDYPYRDKMLHDLVYNIKLKGFKKDSVIELLGEPDRSENGHLYYMVTQKRLGSFPLGTKTLVIKINSDTVEWRKIHGEN